MLGAGAGGEGTTTRGGLGGVNHVSQYPFRPCREVVTLTTTWYPSLGALIWYQIVCLPVRLARRLCALAADFGSEVHISQEQLGIFVGAARESVNRQLQSWRKDGILDLQRGRILLRNITKLTAIARNE